MFLITFVQFFFVCIHLLYFMKQYTNLVKPRPRYIVLYTLIILWMTLLYIHLRVCLLWDSLASINGGRNCLPLLFIIILFIYCPCYQTKKSIINSSPRAVRNIILIFHLLNCNRIAVHDSARYYIGYMAAACIHIAYERHHVYAV